MGETQKNIVDIDDSLRLVGTAHISSASVELVRQQIEEWKPDLVAIELCESRKASLLEPDALDNEDLLKILKHSSQLTLKTSLFWVATSARITNQESGYL